MRSTPPLTRGGVKNAPVPILSGQMLAFFLARLGEFFNNAGQRQSFATALNIQLEKDMTTTTWITVGLFCIFLFGGIGSLVKYRGKDTKQNEATFISVMIMTASVIILIANAYAWKRWQAYGGTIGGFLVVLYLLYRKPFED